MAPVAVARQPHDLPGRAVNGQRLGAGEAAAGVETDDVRRPSGRHCLAAEQLVRRGLGIIRMGERRQRLRIERALVLRGRAACGGELQDDREDRGGCSH
jgi:hypothetical protein